MELNDIEKDWRILFDKYNNQLIKDYLMID